MEVAIPLGTFIVAAAAVIISVISLRWTAKRQYVRTLEARIEYLEVKLEASNNARRQLETEVTRVTRQNHELLNEVHELRQQVDSLQRQ